MQLVVPGRDWKGLEVGVLIALRNNFISWKVLEVSGSSRKTGRKFHFSLNQDQGGPIFGMGWEIIFA